MVESVLGSAAFLIYRFFRWQGFISHVLGGVVIGFLAMLFVAIIYSPFTRATPGKFVLCMSAGAVSGLAFRFIAGEYLGNRRGAISGEI